VFVMLTSENTVNPKFDFRGCPFSTRSGKGEDLSGESSEASGPELVQRVRVGVVGPNLRYLALP
jgi:hypothetical protein